MSYTKSLYICIKAQQCQPYFIHHTPERIALDEGCCWFRRCHSHCSYSKHNWRSRRCLPAMLVLLHTHTHADAYMYICVSVDEDQHLLKHTCWAPAALSLRTPKSHICWKICEMVCVCVCVYILHLPFSIFPAVESCWCFCWRLCRFWVQ